MASTDDQVFVTWQDSRNGNAVTGAEDVYFSAVELGGPPTPVRARKGTPRPLLLGSGIAVGMAVAVVAALLAARGTTRAKA